MINNIDINRICRKYFRTHVHFYISAKYVCLLSLESHSGRILIGSLKAPITCAE